MPSAKRKRKAAAPAGGAEEGAAAASPAVKKSKKELREEARARAKAWRDQKQLAKAAGGGATARKPPPAAPATTGKLPGRSSGTAAASPLGTAGGAVQRRRAAGRRSTGGTADLSRATATTAVRVKREPGRRVRQASSGLSSPSAFEFNPPPKKDEEEEEEDDGMETKEASVQSAPRKSPVKYEFGGRDPEGGQEDEDEEDRTSAKKKREEGLAKIRALREQRKRGGLPTTIPEPPRQPRQHQPQRQRPATADRGRAPAREEGGPAPRRRSLDPPAAVSTATAPAVAVATFDSPNPPPAAAAPTAAAFGSPDPPPAVETVPALAAASKPSPRSDAASLFTGRPAGASSGAPRPGPRQFDPRSPFPAAGPPHRRGHSGGGGDERKSPAWLSPPGRNGSGESGEKEKGAEAVGGGGREVPPAAASADGAPLQVAAAAAAAAPAASAGHLAAAIARAGALVAAVEGSNRTRRAAMGIRPAGAGNDGTARAGGRAGTTPGPPPRDVLRAEGRMDAALEELDGSERLSDPPAADAPAAYARTLQTLRRAGRADSDQDPSRAKEEEKKEDKEKEEEAATVAGEHTSEAGGSKGGSRARAIEDAGPTPRPSLLERGAGVCLAVCKGIMFAQMAFGIIYLAAYYTPSYSWNGDGGAAPAEFLAPEEDAAPCFIDYPIDDDSDDSDMACDLDFKQCPPWGRCRGGKLADCDDGEGSFHGVSLFVPNERGDGCVLGPEAAAHVEATREVLMGMTAAQYCRSSDRVKDPEAVLSLDGDDDFPLFSLEKVAEKTEACPEGLAECMSPGLLLWLRPAMDPKLFRFGWLAGNAGDDQGEDMDALGLGTGVSPGSLPLPFDCTMKLMAWELLQYFARYTLGLLAYLCKMAWFLITTYPLYTIGAVALWRLVVVVRRKRRQRAKVKDLLGPVVQSTYNRLAECENDRGYAALHMRDDVGHEMYPFNFRERKFLNEFVWPRVVLEVQSDNRVRKFRKVVNGKDLEHWDFAIQSKQGYRIRRSMGTPGGTPGGNTETRRDRAPTKRDP